MLTRWLFTLNTKDLRIFLIYIILCLITFKIFTIFSGVLFVANGLVEQEYIFSVLIQQLSVLTHPKFVLIMMFFTILLIMCALDFYLFTILSLAIVFLLIVLDISNNLIYCDSTDEQTTITGSFSHNNTSGSRSISTSHNVLSDVVASNHNLVNKVVDAVSATTSAGLALKFGRSVKGSLALKAVGVRGRGAVVIGAHIGVQGVQNTPLANLWHLAAQSGPLPNRPSSPGLGGFGFAPSPNSNWLYYLPDWLKREIVCRTPEAPLFNSGEFTLLFTKYNLMVLILMLLAVGIIVTFLFIRGLKFIQGHEQLLQAHFPKTLGRFACSNTINFMINTNILSLILMFIIMLQVILFLYNNSFPTDLGDICDKYYSSKNHE